MIARRFAASLIVLLFAIPVAAQTPLTSQFRVNGYTTGSQGRVRAASSDEGDFVLVWTGGSPLSNVSGQRFSRTGTMLGTEFQVSGTGSVYERPGVASDADGDFVVVWAHYPYTAPPNSSVAGRRFASTGSKLGTEFSVNTTIGSYEYSREPAVASGDTGDFVVVWISSQDGSFLGVVGQRFSSGGAALGTEFQVNSFTTCPQYRPAVSSDAVGNFVVTWQSTGFTKASPQAPSCNNSQIAGGLGSGIFGQRYSSGGSASGTEFRISAYTGLDDRESSVAHDEAGEFLVTWRRRGENDRIIARRFSSVGEPIGTEVQVNSDTEISNRSPSVTSDAAGDYVVVWNRSAFVPTGADGVFGRRILSSGAVSGPEFRVNSSTSYAGSPSVAADASGVFIVAWQESGDVFARLFEIFHGNTVGLFAPSPSRFFLRNSNTAGVADIAFDYGPAGAGWLPIAGDWDGDGTTTIGVFDPSRSIFFLRNSNTSGFGDLTVFYGPPGAGWIPIAGDWDGDGVTTIGVFDPAAGVFYLRNSNTTGVADQTFSYGPAGAGWIPIAGDWDGDGITTVGVFDPVASIFYLRNSNTQGFADETFAYGPAGGGWIPIAGDWDGDGITTIALFDAVRSFFFLRNSNSQGFADLMFWYGPQGAGWVPIAGNWDDH